MTGRSPPVAGADTRTWRSSPRSGADRTTGFAETIVVGAFANFCVFAMVEFDMEVPSFQFLRVAGRQAVAPRWFGCCGWSVVAVQGLVIGP
ncbi:hypothetical protein GCM10020216_032230 [Nonomuraea helvata]